MFGRNFGTAPTMRLADSGELYHSSSSSNTRKAITDYHSRACGSGALVEWSGDPFYSPCSPFCEAVEMAEGLSWN